MVTREQILKGKECPTELETNLSTLLDKVNELEQKLGCDLTVTSGFRSMQEHLAIYAAKGITEESKIPMKSKHLYCQAVDFYDPKGELKAAVKDKDYQLLVECDLYMEDAESTPNWLHVQFVSPKSGKREFKP